MAGVEAQSLDLESVQQFNEENDVKFLNHLEKCRFCFEGFHTPKDQLIIEEWHRDLITQLMGSPFRGESEYSNKLCKRCFKNLKIISKMKVKCELQKQYYSYVQTLMRVDFHESDPEQLKNRVDVAVNAEEDADYTLISDTEEDADDCQIIPENIILGSFFDEIPLDRITTEECSVNLRRLSDATISYHTRKKRTSDAKVFNKFTFLQNVD